MEITRFLEQQLAQTRNNIINKAQAAGKNVSGRTLASLVYELTQQPGSLTARLTAAPYFATLEKGRGSAKGGTSGDFLQNLKDWIRAKGIPVRDDKELHRLAAFLKWRINKFGTQQYRQGRTTDIYTQTVQQFMQTVPQQLKQLYSNEIKKIL